MFFFRRLKINHESHEFLLDPSTVANSSIKIGLRRTINNIGKLSKWEWNKEKKKVCEHLSYKFLKALLNKKFVRESLDIHKKYVY